MTEFFGLRKSDLAEIRAVLAAFPNIDQAIIFGSRAKGNFRAGSDVDLALVGPLAEADVRLVSAKLNEESNLPYHFDVLDYRHLGHAQLREHIDRVGQSFYSHA